MMTSLLLLILSLAIFLIPNDALLLCTSRTLAYLAQRNSLQRGERLLSWLDSLGLGEVGFNLNLILPEENSYKHYGPLIHELWEDVRSKGGELRPLLRMIRKELRGELQRERRERSYLNSAYAQLFIMIVAVYLYLWSFVVLVDIQFPLKFWVAIPLYQGIGAVAFKVFLQRLRKRALFPVHSCGRGLLELRVIGVRGNLSLASLVKPEHFLKGQEKAFFNRLEGILECWKSQSRVQLDHILEQEEDLEELFKMAGEKFMSQLKMVCFLWSLLFVLPILFGASLFGLYEMSVV